MRRFLNRTVPVLLAAATTLAVPASVQADSAGPAFTYQGTLMEAGMELTGEVDLAFTLYDAEAGGAAIGASQLFEDVLVVDGVFTVELDFGSAAFAGDARWIEVQVRPGDGSESYTSLEPRQPVTPAPVAWHAMRPWIANGGSYYIPLAYSSGPAHGIGIGVNNPAARLHVRADLNRPAETMRIEDAFSRSQLRIGTPESEGRATLQGWNGETNQPGPLSLNTSGGFVGVGKDNPLANLDVAGSFNVSDYMTISNGPGSGLYAGFDALGTMNGGTLNLQSLTNGPTRIAAGFEVMGDSILHGSAQVRTNLDVVGSGVFGSAVVTGDQTVNGDLNVVGAGTFGSAAVTGGLTLSGDITAQQLPIDVHVGNVHEAALRIHGDSLAGMSFLLGSQEWTTGMSARQDFWLFDRTNGSIRIEVENTPDADAEIQLNGRALISHSAAVDGNLDVAGNLDVTGSLLADGVAGDFDVAGDLGVAGDLDVTGDLFITGDFQVDEIVGLFEQGTDASGQVNWVDIIVDGQEAARAVVFDNGETRIETDTLLLRGGADIAEPFDVSDEQAVQPGMVMVIDPHNPGELRMARSAYDATVAGVVSGAGGVKPGLMLQQTGTIADGEHPIALTGRVYVHVDADANGAVTPGDMLTTSDTPGHAMKCSDRERSFGAVIGKAMTGLESGRGLVLVLVNLQ